MVGDMASALQIASYQRQSYGEDNCDVAGLVEEAVSDWLHKEIYGPTPVPNNLDPLAGEEESPEPEPAQPVEPDIPTTRRRDAALIGLGLTILGAIGLGVAWMTHRGASDLAITQAAAEPLAPEPASTNPLAPGVLIVDAQPWASVERVWDQSGKEVALPADRYTPLRLELPAGDYSVSLVRPGAKNAETCAIQLTPSRTSICVPEQTEIDATGFFKETGWWR